jgi:hypothetical protein
MSTHFPAQSILPWQACLYEGHTAIDFNARYFTKRTDAPNESNHPFLQGVDPQGVLEKLRKHDLIHGPDNQVEYIKLLENDRCAKTSFPLIPPVVSDLRHEQVYQNRSWHIPNWRHSGGYSDFHSPANQRQALDELGFKRTDADHGVFLRVWADGRRIILAAHVDD